MTLEEAINHAEEVAEKKEREKQKWEKWLETDSDYRAVIEKVGCELCAEEHRQLAEWLKDYKRLKEQEPKTGHWIWELEDWNKWICSECGWSKRTDVHVRLGYDFCPSCGSYNGGNKE